MSAPGADSVSGALAAARLTEPAWVREGSAKVQREYALGLEFERLLVQQLTSSLKETNGPFGEEGAGEEAGGGGSAANSVLSSMIPGALADGVVAGGGLGLAEQLTKEIEARAGTHDAGPAAGQTTPTAPSGGVEADITGGARA